MASMGFLWAAAMTWVALINHLGPVEGRLVDLNNVRTRHGVNISELILANISIGSAAVGAFVFLHHRANYHIVFVRVSDG